MLRDLIDPEMYLTWREWRYARYVEKARGQRALARFRTGGRYYRIADGQLVLAVPRNAPPPVALSNRLLEIALDQRAELGQK
jgi:hypothetical protein